MTSAWIWLSGTARTFATEAAISASVILPNTAAACLLTFGSRRDASSVTSWPNGFFAPWARYSSEPPTSTRNAFPSGPICRLSLDSPITSQFANQASTAKPECVPLAPASLDAVPAFRPSFNFDATPILSPCLRSDEHTSELQSLMRHSYAAFCLQKKKQVHKL